MRTLVYQQPANSTASTRRLAKQLMQGTGVSSLLKSAVATTDPATAVEPIGRQEASGGARKANVGMRIPDRRKHNFAPVAPANALLMPRAHSLELAQKGGTARVLVATDLTPEGNQAVARAYGLLPRGGVLRLLHVVHPRALPAGEFDHALSRRATQARHLELLHESKAQLQAIAIDEKDALGVRTEIEVIEHTDPVKAIASVAERFDADVVCMAAVQPDSPLRRIFSSKIQSAMARTGRTFLIVHPDPQPLTNHSTTSTHDDRS